MGLYIRRKAQTYTNSNQKLKQKKMIYQTENPAFPAANNQTNNQQTYYNHQQQQQQREYIETMKLLRVLRQLLPFSEYVDDATLLRNAAAYIQYLQAYLTME